MDEEIQIEPDISLFTPVQVEMTVDPAPIHLNSDDAELSQKHSKYKEEMLKDGLDEPDFDYFINSYKNLEEVKFVRIHCTGCDKHMGSAPNERDNRYQHPILKVLLCVKCYQFYCSGEFEKGEDGSELYCRWCGEGGLVYCCTKCPFVFCKNCIARNLGRGTARIIENTEHWVCFACNPLQIDRHRATYWAIQKYSEEAIDKSKETGDVSKLNTDSNVCCFGKKRIEPREKTRAPVGRKPKAAKVPFDVRDVSNILESTLKCNIPSTSKGRNTQTNNSIMWPHHPLANIEPENEVICTPDIIPIDESPPNSPLISTPPPLIPYVMQQSVPKLQPIQTKGQQIVTTPKIVPVQLKTLQKQFYTPLTIANRSTPISLRILNQQDGLRIVQHPITQTINLDETSKTSDSAETENDWFDKAIVECAEVTEYISTKISSLSGIHSRAQSSERLMQELHNTLQTYIHVAIDKMKKIKKNMRNNFDQEERNNTEKIINPFAKNKTTNTINTHTEDSSSQDTQSASGDDEDTNSSNKKRKREDSIVPTRTKIQRVDAGDDILFDMDVTNASDEESRTSSSVESEAHFQTGEVINIISSSEDNDSDVEEVTQDGTSEKEINKEIREESNTEIEEESNTKIEEESNTKIEKESNTKIEEESKQKEEIEESNKNLEETTEKVKETLNEEQVKENTEQNENNVIAELLEKVETKFNIKNITSNDLLNYLSAKVILYNNRKARKVFAKTATTETKIKQFNVIDTIQDILNTEWEISKQETEIVEKVKEKTPEPCDVEEMLGSVVIRARKSFGDEFSKFIDRSSEGDNCNVHSGDEILSENEDISNTGETNETEIKTIETETTETKDDDSETDEAELFFNKDNESLSLPPDGIGDKINNKQTKEAENSDLVLDSGILALKQMAENCVNPTVELRQASTECNG